MSILRLSGLQGSSTDRFTGAICSGVIAPKSCSSSARARARSAWSGMRLTISSTMRWRSGSSFGAVAGVFAARSLRAAVPGAGTSVPARAALPSAGPELHVRAALAVVADIEIELVARICRRPSSAGRTRRSGSGTCGTAANSACAGRAGTRRVSVPGLNASGFSVRQMRESKFVMSPKQVAQQRAEREHPHLRALAAVRAVLAAQHLAAVEAVLGRERAADELFPVRQHASFGRVAFAELLDALRPHAGRVVAQVGVERRLVAQAVLDDAPDATRPAPCRRRGFPPTGTRRTAARPRCGRAARCRTGPRWRRPRRD